MQTLAIRRSRWDGFVGQEGSEVMVKNLRQLWFGTTAGLVFCFTAWGCTSVEELPAPTGVFSVKGEVIGSAIPERAGTVIYWAPDPYAGGTGYVFGTGRTLGTEFIVSVPSVPTLEQPEGPLVVFGKNYAVGRIYAAYEPLPAEGPGFPEHLLGRGFAPQHAIIYRTLSSNGPGWLSSFPVGFSCAKCVTQGVHHWTPAPCADVEIWAVDDWSVFPHCDW